MADVEVGDQTRLLLEGGDPAAAVALAKEAVRSQWITAWMLTMLLLWPVLYWSWAWSHVPSADTDSVTQLLPNLVVHRPIRVLLLPAAMLGLGMLADVFCGLSLVFQRAKHSRCGFFILHRILPLADVASDLLITFCNEKSILCSDPGLWFRRQSWWAPAHFSLFLILTSFIVSMVLAAPAAVEQLRHRFAKMSERTGLTIWTGIGLPCMLGMSLAAIILYPCQEPPGRLAKVQRMQRVVEILVEAPGQVCLQLWILLRRTEWSETSGILLHLPLTLLVSVSLSAFHLASTLKDCLATARALEKGMLEALCEELSVDLHRRAPLLHVMRSSEQVSWVGQGPLSDAACEQIAKQLQSCPQLLTLRFDTENAISNGAAETLVVAALSSGSGEARVELGSPLQHLSLPVKPVAGYQALGTYKQVRQLSIPVQATTIHQPPSCCMIILGGNHVMHPRPERPVLGPVGCKTLAGLGLGQLQQLRVGASHEVGPEGCAALAGLSQLRQLEIGGVNNMGPEGCEAVARLTQLEQLIIGAANLVGPKGCQALSRMSQLRQLNIGGMNGVGPRGCEALAPLSQLEQLEIGLLNDVGAAGCKALAALGQLRQLSIDDDNDVGPAGCEALARLSHLELLEIGDDNVLGPTGCEALVPLSNLRQLKVGDDNKVGPAGCKALARLSHLERLEIGDDNLVGCKGCKALVALGQLRQLQIGRRNKVGPKGCRALACLSQLERLKVGAENDLGAVDPGSLAGLTQLPQLEIGDLRDTGL